MTQEGGEKWERNTGGRFFPSRGEELRHRREKKEGKKGKKKKYKGIDKIYNPIKKNSTCTLQTEEDGKEEE